MGEPLIPNYRLFVYGFPIGCNEHGQTAVVFGFKVGDLIVVKEDRTVLVGPIQKISYN